MSFRLYKSGDARLDRPYMDALENSGVFFTQEEVIEEGKRKEVIEFISGVNNVCCKKLKFPILLKSATVLSHGKNSYPDLLNLLKRY